jgi:hypothetical protein
VESFARRAPIAEAKDLFFDKELGKAKHYDKKHVNYDEKEHAPGTK